MFSLVSQRMGSIEKKRKKKRKNSFVPLLSGSRTKSYRNHIAQSTVGKKQVADKLMKVCACLHDDKKQGKWRGLAQAETMLYLDIQLLEPVLFFRLSFYIFLLIHKNKLY